MLCSSISSITQIAHLTWLLLPQDLTTHRGSSMEHSGPTLTTTRTNRITLCSSMIHLMGWRTKALPHMLPWWKGSRNLHSRLLTGLGHLRSSLSLLHERKKKKRAWEHLLFVANKLPLHSMETELYRVPHSLYYSNIIRIANRLASQPRYSLPNQEHTCQF